ncbi:hypothetical protein Plec18167_004388 [Paecilomyces lecythidis]|uniref:Uncharacterized protein n=1 Tax=Paecilomyces lecythidis TaxID=3004212 RepID=A0ABR3XQP5_9EURO
MIFNKAILLLCAAVSPFALAEPAAAASTVTLTVLNAHSSTPTPTPTPTPSPSSTPVHKFIASTGTGAPRFTPSAGRWNSTIPVPSNPVKAPSEPASSAASGAASVASSSPAATGAAAGHDVAGAAMMAGVVAVAGLVML